MLDQLLVVAPGERVSDLERWRKGPAPRGSGPAMIKALDQVSEIKGLELAGMRLEDLVPPRRLAELARYGMAAKATALRRHPDTRRLATLMATVRHLEAKSVDDTLELLDLLMSTELLGRARTAADKEKVRKPPRLTRATAKLAVAVEVMLEAGAGGSETEVRVAEVWEAIEAVVSRAELRAAVATVNEMVPPPGAEADADDWRGELVGRIVVVSGFLKVLTRVIDFGTNAEGEAVLAAMRALPEVLAHRSAKLPAPLVAGQMIDPQVVAGPWKRLVFGHPTREDASVDRNAYTFCVLEQFHRHLKRREIHADASNRWRNPAAQLLEGPAWEAVKGEVLRTLGLPENPDALLVEHSRTLDDAYRQAGDRLKVNPAVRIDDDGKVHLSGVKAIEEPPSLVDLRKRTAAMLPRVDLPEVILEVMAWEPEIAAAFTAASGGRTRLGDLGTSIAACLAAHSMNVGYRPVSKKGVPALERSRLSHVFQNYFRRDHRPGQRAVGDPPGHHPPRPGVGRWPGRRGRRDAVRGPGPERVRPSQPQVLRAQARDDLAERDQRSRCRAGRQGGVGHGPRLLAHGRCDLRPRRRGTARDRGFRYRFLQRPGVRSLGAAGHLLPSGVGGSARSEGLADRHRGGLRAAEHLRPREDRPGQGPQPLVRHPAGHRLHLHRHRPRLRRGDDAAARRAPHRPG